MADGVQQDEESWGGVFKGFFRDATDLWIEKETEPDIVYYPEPVVTAAVYEPPVSNPTNPGGDVAVDLYKQVPFWFMLLVGLLLLGLVIFLIVKAAR
ncbi:MAG: hypothetical protein HOL04_11840 [Gammaproteobacteria bacterium]|jgi:hypothetical protein|nr:hypothetical protein [Gammaproteobacteria bacterium]MBT4607606.1 hypothetical protein [Thiotrichales bacterium]MBT3472390.1 hypothetical protein [Gammaproteobacteria bacterium]MBT3968623.1 hypothetical protein [Gammaproteobacteria bacterium]MBT4079029.1 hypothetical protein [Gammaproteobacteria bacterium]